MPHLSEERNIPATAAQVWRVIADTKRWPQFYATPSERLHLRSVELLDGAATDGPDVKRRLHFLGVPSWDEQATKWREHEFLMWLGIRNPGMKYWTQQMELIPGKGYCTLRWDIFYSLKAPRAAKKVFKRTLEDLMVASLARVEKLIAEENATPRMAGGKDGGREGDGTKERRT